MKKLFSLGKTVITRAANEALNQEDVSTAMDKHSVGIWGNLCDEDKQQNNAALTNGDRIFSAYVDSNDTKFWIITEADRSCTTVLLPQDY